MKKKTQNQRSSQVCAESKAVKALTTDLSQWNTDNPNISDSRSNMVVLFNSSNTADNIESERTEIRPSTAVSSTLKKKI